MKLDRILTFQNIAIIKDTQGSRDTTAVFKIVVLGTFISDTLTARSILDSNGLTTRPAVASGFFYSNNRLVSISAGWGQFYVRILKIPSEIGNLHETLTELTIHNYIDTTGVDLNLPEDVRKLFKLTTLNLLGRYMTDLPDGISNLTNIITDGLDLSGNKLPINSNPSEPWESWANTYDPDWRSNQILTVIESP